MSLKTYYEMGFSLTVPIIMIAMLPSKVCKMVSGSIKQIEARLKGAIDCISESLYGPPIWTEGPSAIAWFLGIK